MHNYDTRFSEIDLPKSLLTDLKIEAFAKLNWDQGIFLIQCSKQEMFEVTEYNLWTLKEVNKNINSAYSIEESPEDTFYRGVDDVVWTGE